MLLRVPLNATPIGVRAVDTITASFIAGYADSKFLRHYNPAKEKGDASILVFYFLLFKKLIRPHFLSLFSPSSITIVQSPGQIIDNILNLIVELQTIIVNGFNLHSSRFNHFY